MLSGCATYRAGVALPDTDTPVTALAAAGRGRLAWLALHDPAEEECQRLAGVMHLPPALAAALSHPDPRPGVLSAGEDRVLTSAIAHYDPAADLVRLGSLTALLRPGVLVTVTRRTSTSTTDLRRRMEQHQGPLAQGPSFVVHAILDEVADGYADVLRDLRGDVEVLERAVFADVPPPQVTQRIYLLKREAIDFHQASAALTGVLDDLAEGDQGVDGDDGVPDWGALRDRVGRVDDRATAVSDLLTGILTAYQTDVALQQNEDMRKISAWVAIAAVPTMLAGIYGMNFEHMPELRQPWGYPAVVLVMVAVCVGLYALFRRKRWL